MLIFLFIVANFIFSISYFYMKTKSNSKTAILTFLYLIPTGFSALQIFGSIDSNLFFYKYLTIILIGLIVFMILVIMMILRYLRNENNQIKITLIILNIIYFILLSLMCIMGNYI